MILRNVVWCLPQQINRNMRCIEIEILVDFTVETSTINRNMRCIEMTSLRRFTKNDSWINRNMRCIEISILDNSFTLRE